MSWEKTTIGEHCTVTSSKRFHLSDRTNCGVPFYCSKEIIQKVKSEEIDNCDYISEEFYEAVAQKYGVPQENDLLVTTRGTIGVPYLYKKSDRFYFADGNLTWMKDFQSTLLPQYLYYWFLSYEGQSKIDSIAKGTAQKAVPIAGIKTLELLLPPIEIQCRIADILSAYDDLIENNRKQIKLLEEAARRLYQEWFVDLRFPGHEHTKIVDGVPEGWEKRKLLGSFDYVRGKSYSSRDIAEEGPVLMVNLKNIRSFGGYNRNAEKYYVGEFKESQLLSAGDIVMGVTDMTQERRLVGHVAIIPRLHKPTIFSMDLIKLEPKHIPKYFLYSALQYGDISRQIAPLANGVNVLHLKPDAMSNLEMLIPDNSLMEQYQQIFGDLYEKIETLYEQCDLATQARDRLLPKLISGEVEV